MNGLLQDLRYAFRQFRRSPGFTCTSALILALGMGSSLAIFAFVDAALIKPLPYPDSNRLVEVTESVAILPRANLILSGLSRLEEAQPCLHFHGRVPPNRLPPEYSDRCGTGAWRDRERRVLSHAGCGARDRS